jgi:mannose-1-phosphate guanylyltransferase
VGDRIRTAFVLGAGLGTRLRPLTDVRPKPLVPIFHKPLITFALDHLISVGVENFLINTHHLSDQFTRAFPSGEYRGKPIQLIFEPELLETGGGIRNVRHLLGDQPFLVYSGDILTDLDLSTLIDEHFSRQNDVTLGLRETGFAPSIQIQDGRIVDIRKQADGPPRYDFANVSVWNSSIHDRIPEGKISFIPVLSEWIRQGGRIGGRILNERSWFNIGSRKEYLEVHRTILETGWKPAYLDDPDWPQPVGKGARIAPSARLDGFSAVGDDSVIEEEAVVQNSVIWENAKIASRSRLEGCIVRNGRLAEGTRRDADI